MQTYTPTVGQTINRAAAEMIMLANKTNDTVMAKFNDIEIKANPCENEAVGVATIKAYYISESDCRAEAYRNSPEGKRAAAEAEDRKQKLQMKMDEAMSKLESLDFSDLVAVIDWLEEVRDPSDHIGVNTPSKEIVKFFGKHGFKPGVNCGKDFDGDSEENFAHWLIGQALDDLKSVGAIHQVFHKFADDWRQKFDHAA